MLREANPNGYLVRGHSPAHCPISPSALVLLSPQAALQPLCGDLDPSNSISASEFIVLLKDLLLILCWFKLILNYLKSAIAVINITKVTVVTILEYAAPDY